MAYSLIKNNTFLDITFHILCIGVDDTEKQEIKSFIKENGANCLFYDIDTKWVANNLPETTGHISVATFMRCFSPKIIPHEIDKAIYIDCDLVVLGSLKKMWDTDISDVAVAAVEDMWALKCSANGRLGYKAQDSYFNAGVLLINMKKWREIDIPQKTLDFLKEYNAKLDFYDQDILNGILHDQKKFLPVQYNMQDGFYRVRRKNTPSHLAQEADKWLKRPVILHYTGKHKPWEYKCYHPLRDKFIDYMRQTPYRDYKPKKKLSDVIEIYTNHILWSLGLIKPKYRKI